MFDENEHIHPQTNDEGPRHIHRGIKRSEPETGTDASVRAAEASGAAPQTVGAAAPQRARPR